jgi:uncharacterized protein (DUF1499 family)
MAMGLIYLVLGGVVLVLVAGQLGFLRGSARGTLGVSEGKLQRPSKTENSVSSQSALWPEHPMRAYAEIAPLPLVGGSGPATLERLKTVITAMPGATVVDSRADYVYATFETKWLKFVDDVEFWFDPAANVIQVRSASRLGRKDFGVNRARVEAIRRALAG